MAALVLALQLVSAALGTRAADARNACASAHARRCGFRCARAAKAATACIAQWSPARQGGCRKNGPECARAAAAAAAC